MVKKKGKVILPPELPPAIADDDIEVSDEDLDFVRENKGYAGFINKLDTKSIDKHVARVANRKEDEVEAMYEKRRMRQKPKEEEEKKKKGLEVDRVDVLPIKTLDGQIRFRMAKEWSSETAPGGKNSVTGVEDNDQEEGVAKLTKAERRQKLKKSKKEAKKQEKEDAYEEVVERRLHSDVLANVEKDLSAEELFAKKKIRLAEIGLALLEDPESNIKSLKELLEICEDSDDNIVRLGLMSLSAVFRDIIPGYRIRLPTEKELQMTVSKEVQKTRFYESTLLRTYQAYLRRLKELGKRPTFRHVAVRCMCTLLEAVPHFNFRENLLVFIVKNIGTSDDVVRKHCREAVKSLFVNEGKHGGEATLEAVRLIADLVKAHDCQLHPDSIDVFLSLTFDDDLGRSEAVEEENVKPKKQKGRNKRDQNNLLQVSDKKRNRQDLMARTREEVNADFKSVLSIRDPKEKRKMQSVTLSAIFETYFRILKRSMDSSVSRGTSNDGSIHGGSGAHPLLAPCLNGLGKFSHLIDLDFMGDLMECLKKLASHSQPLGGSSQNYMSVSERLQCCIVAFRVMRNNLDALNVDLQEFFVQFYNLLLEYRANRDRGEVLAEALKTMLWEGKQHDMHRSAAFIKRLATFSLCFGSAEAMAALVTLKHLLQKNTRCRNLLENDAGGGSLSGLVVKYQPEASDPSLSGALASVLWELSLLKKHYNHNISSMATSILGMANINPTQNQIYIPTVSPVQAFTDMSMEKELSKPTSRPALNRKRKRGKGREFVLMNPLEFQRVESSVDEEEVKCKLEDHFTVLRDVAEKEKLRAELNHTSRCISLYEEYKKQRNKAPKQSKRKKQMKSSDSLVEDSS